MGATLMTNLGRPRCSTEFVVFLLGNTRNSSGDGIANVNFFKVK